MTTFIRWLPIALAAVLPACGSAAAPAAPPSAAAGAPAPSTSAAAAAPTKWEDVLAAAKKEGQVAVYGPPGANYRQALVEPFESANPGIKVNFTGATGSDIGPRMLSERQAGKYLADLHIGGTTTMTDLLKPANALDPLAPLLLRPEVTDPSKWYQNKLWWADVEQKYVLMFEGGVSQLIVVNKTQVDPNSFSSYWDVLDAKYRGKIVASDIRKPGPGGGQSRFVWLTEELGKPFLQTLFGEMSITLSEDRRQMTDWLAQGRYAINFFPGGDEPREGIKQGLPLAFVDDRKLKEGFPMSAAFGAVVAPTNRPHPNAAIVYLNWLLGPQGQQAWQKALTNNSLRTDIPKDAVDPLYTPPASGKVFFASLEEYSKVELGPIRDTISQALEKKQ
jgi:iron(III) transport system substrate-binding protein